MHASRIRIPLVLRIAIFAVVAAPQLAGAREVDTVTHRLGDDLFMAGGDLRSAEQVAGDAVLAGGRIETSGTVHGDEVAAGGEVNLGANIEGGVYAAGGRVRLDGKVARNARLAGGKVEVSPEADVQGGVTIGAAEVEVNGKVGRYLQVGAASTRIDGHVGGDVDVASGELNVGPGAVIDGVLTYYGPHPPAVAAGAQIKGGLHYVERKHWTYNGRTGMRAFGIGSWLLLIGWMIVGMILLALWPGFSRSVTDVALHRPGMALLLGFAVLVCTPIAIVLAMITIIGIPMALLAICLYLVLLALGYLASAAAIGEWLLSRMRRGGEIVARERVLMLLGVLVILFIVARIPVLGGTVKFLLILAGVGSLAMAALARHRAA